MDKPVKAIKLALPLAKQDQKPGLAVPSATIPGAESRIPGLPSFPPTKPIKPARSGVETLKEESKGLRSSLAAELNNEEDHFKEAEKQILKFHGIYQQDDRDNRHSEKAYSFMVRTKLPGGRLTAEQYLVHEDLADRFGNGTLRITTRQDFQFHGIVKGDLKASLQELNEHLITTLGACGDVVRNVMYSPKPSTRPFEWIIEALAQRISDELLPSTKAYHEIWVDGEQVYDGKQVKEPDDPIYGKTYLPRKFKIGIAYPGDNSIDVFTQDVGLIAVVNEDQSLAGFNVTVGGGLGMTHKKPDTFPRLGDLLAFVTPDETLDVIKQIVLIHRDFGDRTNRKHARLKYIVHEWGIDRFRKEVEDRVGFYLKPIVPTPPLELELYLGWHRQTENTWYLGLSVENGRIKDEGSIRLKSALHEVISRFGLSVALTPSQDILLIGIPDVARKEVEFTLRSNGVLFADEISVVRRYAMACPALPTCGLAISESERVLPSLIDQLETELALVGLQDDRLTVRMTGCPNGCARPYVADIGFVGRSLDSYTIFLGGRSDGTRLNQPYKDLVPLNELVSTLRPLFHLYRDERLNSESFGDYCHRIGVENLLTKSSAYHEHTKVG